MGGEVPKQFLMLQDRPVLWYTVETFLAAYPDLEIMLVVPAGHREAAKSLIDSCSAGERVRIADGGDTRFHSVRNGLAKIMEELGRQVAETGSGLGEKDLGTSVGAEDKRIGLGKNAIIFVHDGVRCLVTMELIRRCYEQAVELGSAVPVVDCRDSVRLVEDGGRSKPIDRSRIKLVQTPQTFRGDILLGAYKRDHQEAFTDEATVVEVAGHEVHLIEGEQTNIKITTPTDMGIAEHLLGRRGK